MKVFIMMAIGMAMIMDTDNYRCSKAVMSGAAVRCNYVIKSQHVKFPQHPILGSLVINISLNLTSITIRYSFN